MMHFGEHLMIDGYGGELAKLDSEKLILQCLHDLPAKLGMNILGEPQVFYAPGGGEKDPGGWSGFVVIAESHISIHTFPKRGFVSVDVYTCKNGLDTEIVSDYFTHTFGLKDVEKNFVKRGTRYPGENIY